MASCKKFCLLIKLLQIVDLRGTKCKLTFLNKQNTEFEKAMTMFAKL